MAPCALVLTAGIGRKRAIGVGQLAGVDELIFVANWPAWMMRDLCLLSASLALRPALHRLKVTAALSAVERNVRNQRLAPKHLLPKEGETTSKLRRSHSSILATPSSIEPGLTDICALNRQAIPCSHRQEAGALGMLRTVLSDRSLRFPPTE